MDYTLFPGNRKFYARYKLLDEESGYPFTDKLQFYVMDLTAIEMAKDEDKEHGLVDWANAFSAKDWKAVEKIENSGVKEARKTMETIMSSDEQRRMIWKRRIAQLDYKSAMIEAEERGEARGEARGVAKGEIRGTIRTYYEDYHLSPTEILQKIMKRFTLEEKDAKTYVEETLGVTLESSAPTLAESATAFETVKEES